jgi:acyl-coenzyme A synthetase/AMP-(fatty) acid ligase
MNKASEIISFWAHLKPTEIAFADESHEVSFRELDMYTRKIGFLLKEKGIKRGEVVGLIVPGYLGWLFSLSLFRLGVSTMVKNSLSAFSPELIPDWVIGLEQHPDIGAERMIIVDEDYLMKVNSSKELDVFEGFASPGDIATFFSTSGTNGETKYKAVGAQHIWAEALRLHSSSAFGIEGILILFQFGAGWSTQHAIKCLILGKTYYHSRFTDFRLPKFVSKYPIRTIVGSPTQISSFIDIQKQTGTQLPLLKSVIMGGSPPSDQLVSRIKAQLNCKIYNSYGSTEAGFIAVSRLGNNEAEGAWIAPQIELQIVDDSDNQLPSMSVGHIRYRRDDMVTSYYKNPTATAQFFRNGFFYPGDLGFIDHAGRLLLEGRSTDVLNLGGVKISPERIESIALAQIGVRDCAVFAALGDSGVEKLCIAVVVDADFDRENFEESMASKSPHAIDWVQIVSAIPRNETGKIQRNLLGAE